MIIDYFESIEQFSLFLTINKKLSEMSNKELEEIASPEFREPGITYAFYVFGSAIIALLLSSLYYYYRVGSRRSIIFCFLAYSWLITDVASCFAYYVSVYEMYYLERIAYVASLFLLINYGLNTGLLDRERKHSIEYSE